MSMFTMGVVLAAALLRPVLILVGAALAGRLLWRRWHPVTDLNRRV